MLVQRLPRALCVCAHNPGQRLSMVCHLFIATDPEHAQSVNQCSMLSYIASEGTHALLRTRRITSTIQHNTVKHSTAQPNTVQAMQCVLKISSSSSKVSSDCHGKENESKTVCLPGNKS